MSILTANLLLSTLIFWITAKIYLLPRLPELEPQTILLPVFLLHSFRHLGLMFLAPGATCAGIPPQFAYPAAFGDRPVLSSRWERFQLRQRGIGVADFSYGPSTSKDRWI